MKNFVLAMALISATPAVAAPITVAEVTMNDSVTRPDSTQLFLKGAGLRTRFMLKVYVIGLYAPQGAELPALLAKETAKRVELVLKRNVEKAKMISALTESIEKNTTTEEFKNLAADLAAFAGMFNDKDFHEPNRTSIDYTPGTGLTVQVNGETRGKVVANPDFAAALFKVWLGDKPADADLKAELLGKKA